MAPTLSARFERLPLRAPFRISRGVKTHAEVVVVELSDGGLTGRGECVPYARYDETPGKVMAALRGDPEILIDSLPPGAARNGLDCAFWDLLAKREGEAVFDMLGRMPPEPVPSAVTISLDAPGGMAEAAAAAREAPLLKVKLSADRPAERLLAVADAAPAARLIVDPNESWTLDILKAMEAPIARCRVVLVEQPLPEGRDAALEGLSYPAPICADESVHTREDLPAVLRRYQAVNVKLDKAGGLTEAVALAQAARAEGLSLMVGCMVASSLAIAPAFVLAGEADFIDLDGPWWIAGDRPGGCRFERGVLHPPQPGFWGDPSPAG